MITSKNNLVNDYYPVIFDKGLPVYLCNILFFIHVTGYLLSTGVESDILITYIKTS